MLTISSGTAVASRAPTTQLEAVLRLMTGAVQSLSRRVERSRQLRALAELDDHLLRDIGLGREHVRHACSQSFWML
jgi:uncharacterized protein YjiS (DUF1127 family)